MALLLQRSTRVPRLPSCQHRQLPSSLRPACPVQRRSAPNHIARAAAGYGATPQDDPYKVLGVAPGSDSNTVQAAYRRKMSEAKGNEAATKRIEAAHSRLIMMALSARMKGGGAVPKEVRFADQEPLLPWLPRWFRANIKYIGIMTAVIGGAVAYAWINKTSTAITIIGIGLVGNYIKQSAINPPPRNPEMADEEKGIVTKNLLRSLLLTLLATIPAYLLVNNGPQALAPYYPQVTDLVNRPEVQERWTFVLSAVVGLLHWLLVCFFR